MARATDLARDSIAAIVLDAHRASRHLPSRPRATTLASDGPAEIVLGSHRAPATRRLSLSLAAASLLHGGLGVAALSAASRTAHDAPAARTSPPLRIDHVVDLAPPEPPPAAEPPPALEPPPEVRPAQSVDRAPPVARAAPATPPQATPPPPAAAGQAVTADDSANQPLDFTSFDLSTGSGQRYAGGVTAASGTNTRAVHTADVDRNAPPDRAQGASRARPVGLPARDWRCPWPHEADQLSIDERIVVIRVVVRPDGSVTSAELVSDPGFGFGAVALACARSQRFPPATDDDGQAITATSPPVRIKFTRD